MQYRILVVKESQVGEQRVSLTPNDVSKLVAQGHDVTLETQAGIGSGCTDEDYQAVGADIRYPNEGLSNLFDDVDLIVRAKRPNHQRESLENGLLKKGMIMLGSLDPFNADGAHVDAYKQAGIVAYSIDQLNVPLDNPMNILASMSTIAGKLAVEDAIEKATISPIKSCVVIGAGTAGMAAVNEALGQELSVQVVVSRSEKVVDLQAQGIEAVLLDGDLSLSEQQAFISDLVKCADIVITTARRPKQKAPILIPASTLDSMQPGACVVDLALGEGGNVEGSEHDATHVLGNEVIVTNVSGYPKSQPVLASEKWSAASLAFIEHLAKGENDLIKSAKLF